MDETEIRNEEDPGRRMPDPAGLARRLLRATDRASLATNFAGRPYVSLVLSATAADGAPLLLISRLAQHTSNIAADPSIALLYDGTAGLEDPLTGPRVSLLGRAEEERDATLRGLLMARFVARHPGAALYASFADFAIWRIAVERAHLVAGFGRIHWVEGGDLLPPDLALAPELEAAFLAEAETFGARVCGEGWSLTGLDREGADFRRSGAVLRLDFADRPGDAAAIRRELSRPRSDADLRRDI